MNEPNEFESLALPNLDLMFRVAMTYARDPATAEDLVQTSMVKALQRFDSFRRGTNIRAWLLRILHNTWIDQLRHRRVVGPELQVEEQFLAGPEATDDETMPPDLVERFSDEHVIRALRDLPDEQRLALLLVDVEQMPHGEVADLLGVAVGTIKSRTSRARTELRQRLREHAEDLGFTKRTER